MSNAIKNGNRALQIVRRYHPNVKSVVDAQRSIYIEVSGRFVRGASAEPNNCPLAKACRSEMELEGALISRGVCYLIRNEVAERYVPSGISRSMLRAYDKTRKFVSGIYLLSVPPPSQTLDAREKRRAAGGKGKPFGKFAGKKLSRTHHLKGERTRLS
jgi:hypothetical protein